MNTLKYTGSIQRILCLTLFTLLTSTTQASYLSLGESGEQIPGGTFQVGLAPQAVTNGDRGFNMAAFLDAAWTDSFSSRFLVGAGDIDFYVSGSGKFVPFPDVARQPAIGIKLNLWYAREGASNINTIQLAPLVSKKYENDYGLFVPYAAYGISNTNASGHTQNGEQFFFGTDWKNPTFGNLNLTGEVAASLKDSVSSISVFASFPFDDKNGIRF
jgi:hypothetical protein